jgi:excisionase family DNA binding protein
MVFMAARTASLKGHGGVVMVVARVLETVERQGYNVSEGARIVGVGRTTMHKLIREGRIKVVKIGARTIIPRHEIDRILSGDAAA